MSDQTHLEATLQRDIDTIRSKVQRMAGLAESALSDSLKALLDKNGQLAYSVILHDREIDDYEKEIDRLCLEFLVRQQPAAGPLRFVYATIKINLELERIGDYAESIARRGLVVNSLDLDLDYSDFEAISANSLTMLKDAIRAFLEQDADLAKTTMLAQREANRMRDKINDVLFQLRAEDKIPITALTPLQTIARRLERVADQSKNICEETLYMCTGQYMKHLGRDTFRVLFVDDDNAGASQVAEAIGNALGQANFVFSSAGISAEKVTEETIGFLKAKGHDISSNISKSVDNIPNLDHYQVVVALSESAQNAFPAPPTKTISIAWELGQAEGDIDTTYAFLSQNINDLVQAILGHTSNNNQDNNEDNN
ncbi:MAG: phosphate signaling complex protein PhoU [Verrucomicrobia bacterium]|nr:phosphate signaling complex protein PhoU [Verrucomicrobiota bacterium]